MMWWTADSPNHMIGIKMCAFFTAAIGLIILIWWFFVTELYKLFFFLRKTIWLTQSTKSSQLALITDYGHYKQCGALAKKDSPGAQNKKLKRINTFFPQNKRLRT